MAAISSEINSASISRNDSVHFWRFAESTVALKLRLATSSVTNGPAIEATSAVHAEMRLSRRDP